MSIAGFFFYTGDWIKDTRVLDVSERGAWIDILCVMSERDGSVTWPLQAYQQYWGLVDENSTQPQADTIIAAFERYDICEVVTERNGYITLRCRRMTRDLNSRENNKKRQERFRKKRESNGSVTEKNSVLPSPSPSLNTSLASSYKNTQKPETASPSPSAVASNWDKKTREEKHMASMNLIPELKAAADAVYYSDPVKFKRIAGWIAQGRKNKWSEESMAAALREFKEGHFDLIDEWYPYLDTILARVDKDRNRDAAEAEHEKHKEEVREASKMFLVK